MNMNIQYQLHNIINILLFPVFYPGIRRLLLIELFFIFCIRFICQPAFFIATHVLQFFCRSLFFKFDFPCAYFLTKGATAVQINRVFWLGVSLLHSYGFDVVLVCCDGASTNRSFYTMNATNKLHSTIPYFSCLTHLI